MGMARETGLLLAPWTGLDPTDIPAHSPRLFVYFSPPSPDWRFVPPPPSYAQRLYLITAAGTMVIPTAALVVLMSPIVLSASADLGIAPQTAMMAVAMAASASFTSPISHPANILVMGPGGYRFADYLKLGLPLTAVVFVTVMLLLPVFWPLTPVP